MKTLKLACIDADAPPLFGLLDAEGTRPGYEPEAAGLVAERMGRRIEWVVLDWDDMLPAVCDGRVDAAWCGQGIIPVRERVVAFTRPYAIFDESVLVRKGDPARSPDDLAGYRVGAIEGSANMTLAQTFSGAELVSFTGDNVYEQMLRAVASGAIDAMVDDDVVLVPMGEHPDYELAFTVATRNPWGVAVDKANTGLLEELNDTLEAVIRDGSLEQVWAKWMPSLSFPLRAGTDVPA